MGSPYFNVVTSALSHMHAGDVLVWCCYATAGVGTLVSVETFNDGLTIHRVKHEREMSVGPQRRPRRIHRFAQQGPRLGKVLIVDKLLPETYSCLYGLLVSLSEKR